MVMISLGPGKFYGSSLPRPWLYTDVKLNSERVDPPTSVLDPLISWADEAHWSMGGRSTKRLRLQGRIEGNVQKLREQIVKKIEKREQGSVLVPISGSGKTSGKKYSSTDSPPPAPFARKRKLTLLVDWDEDEEGGDGETNREEESGRVVRVRNGRRLVRKLNDDFDQVADEGGKKKGDGDLRSVKGKNSRSKAMFDNDGEKGENLSLRSRSRRSVEMESDGGANRIEEGKRNVMAKESDRSGGRGHVPSRNGTRASPRLMKKFIKQKDV